MFYYRGSWYPFGHLSDAVRQIKIDPIDPLDADRMASIMARRLYIQCHKLTCSNFLEVAEQSHLDNNSFWLLDDIVCRMIDVRLATIERRTGLQWIA